MALAFLSLLILVAVNSLQTASCTNENDSRFSSNAIIYQIFEMFRSLILNGDADKNIPVSDPFDIKANELQFHLGIIHGELNITNGVLTGLGSYRLEEFDFNKEDRTLDLKITLPLLKFEAECYELKGNIFEALPLAGSGIIYVSSKHITINTKMSLKQSENGKSVLIGNLENTSFTVGKIVSLTEFDKNIDHILNALIDDYLAGYLTRFSRYFADQYKGSVLSTVNPVLNQYETWSIFSMIL